jgi:AraC-like DNA-binding protein
MTPPVAPPMPVAPPAPAPVVEGRFVLAAPHPALLPYVGHYLGYAERADGELRRREVPISRAVLILGWGEPLTVTDPRAPRESAGPLASFVTGLFDSYVVTGTRGLGRGVELMLSPLGARRLLGLPLGELTNRTVDPADLPGRWLGSLAARLADAPGWAARFALLDDALLERLVAGDPPDPRLAGAWRLLERSGGRLSVASIADRVGWSRRHLAATVHRELGLPPKTLARVVRFERAFGALGLAAAGGWAAVAAECGYADQAHLIREFREFAGATPVELAVRRLAAGGIRD